MENQGASFDLAQLDIATPSDRGSDMTVMNHATGKPATKGDGTLVKITLLGRYSQVYLDTERKLAIDNASKADMDDTPEARLAAVDASQTKILAAVTKAWTIDVLDGNPFPCTPENAVKLYSDRRFIAIRQQAWSHINTIGNFTKA